MKIEENKVVTIDYTLTDTTGNILDKAENGSFAYLHGAFNIIPGLENAFHHQQGQAHYRRSWKSGGHSSGQSR